MQYEWFMALDDNCSASLHGIVPTLFSHAPPNDEITWMSIQIT